MQASALKLGKLDADSRKQN